LIDIDFDNPAFPDGIFANFDETRETTGWEIGLNAGLTGSRRCRCARFFCMLCAGQLATTGEKNT